jgi:hypothetical protein
MLFRVYVPSIRCRDESRSGLVLLLGPRANFELWRKRRRGMRILRHLEIHEHSRMPAEALRQKRPCDFSRFVRQQLRLDAVNSRRLLQGLDDVTQKSFFHFASVKRLLAFADKEVADHALALLVNEKRVAEDPSAFDGRVTGKDLGIHVAKNHLGRTRVVPGKKTRPHGNLLLQQRAKVSSREVAEIEDFHGEVQVSGLRYQVSGKSLHTLPSDPIHT